MENAAPIASIIAAHPSEPPSDDSPNDFFLMLPGQPHSHCVPSLPGNHFSVEPHCVHGGPFII